MSTHLNIPLTEQKLMAIWAGTVEELKQLLKRTQDANGHLTNDYVRLKAAYGQLAEENKKLKRAVMTGRQL